ncbi:MAG: type II toxin-antitoxin system Phd/YefM family antitoxin [Gemmatimonadetes bacterium]|nr:MAG: type II toxin-antitoxin system Phd/YefM family antitoxin [Gemmatimonadota bacterium]
MRIKNIREVKAKLSQVVSELPHEGSVVITKNGKACAVLMPVSEETDLEVVALSQNRSFWKLFDGALERASEQGWTPVEDL